MTKTREPEIEDYIRQDFDAEEIQLLADNPPSNENEEHQDFNKSVLIGQPVPWSEIREDENKKQWLWENYIAKGNITLLSALWKAGKTTFLRCLFLAMKNQEEFAGQPTTLCKILIISEEAKGEWADNREDFEDDDIKHVLVWSRPVRGKPNLKQWTTLTEEVSKKCIEEKIDLVVIDTLTTFWPIDNENDSAQVIKALVPLYSFSENNIAVLLVHHFRKGGGDQAQASRGSGALPGFVDNIIEFTRSDEGFPNQRTLKTYGRFDAVIPEVVIEYTEDGKYLTKGEPWQVSKSARLKKIVDIFGEAGRPLSAREVFTIWCASVRGTSLRSIYRYLRELLESKLIVCVREETVTGKKVPFYAQTGWKEVTSDSPQPLPMRPVLSQVNKETVTGAVTGEGQTSLATPDMTGTSPNTVEVSSEDKKDENAENNPFLGKEPPKSLI